MGKLLLAVCLSLLCARATAQTDFDAKMRRAGLVDVGAADTTLRVRLMYALVKGTPNQVYVANGARGGRHNYGVAVDVTLLDEQGREADMGTPVDFFGPEAASGAEAALRDAGKISAAAAGNRWLLREVMRRAGLVPYRREWWHFEEPMPMSEVRTRYRLLDF